MLSLLCFQNLFPSINQLRTNSLLHTLHPLPTLSSNHTCHYRTTFFFLSPWSVSISLNHILCCRCQSLECFGQHLLFSQSPLIPFVFPSLLAAPSSHPNNFQLQLQIDNIYVAAAVAVFVFVYTFPSFRPATSFLPPLFVGLVVPGGLCRYFRTTNHPMYFPSLQEILRPFHFTVENKPN